MKLNVKKEEHTYTSDQKLKWFGYGEWVEESDHLEFEYLGYDCMIHRICLHEPSNIEKYYFGGHLCGYVKLPEDHPYQNTKYEDMYIECHGGLTLGNKQEQYWIGFDCAHSFDIIPSVNFFKYLDDKFFELIKKFNLEDSPILKRDYRNMSYVIKQCISIVKQLKKIAKCKIKKGN